MPVRAEPGDGSREHGAAATGRRHVGKALRPAPEVVRAAEALVVGPRPAHRCQTSLAAFDQLQR